jgi:hypothetical protein
MENFLNGTETILKINQDKKVNYIKWFDKIQIKIP